MHAFFLCGLSESSHAQTAWPNGNLATVTLVACDTRVKRLRMSAACIIDRTCSVQMLHLSAMSAAREVLSYLAVALSSHDSHQRLSAARQKPCKPHPPHTVKLTHKPNPHVACAGQRTLERLTRIEYFES